MSRVACLSFLICGVGHAQINGTNVQQAKMRQVWFGAHKTGTNGIASELEVFRDADGISWMAVLVGSETTNSSGHFYCAPPDGKFAMCELKDSKGRIIPSKGNPLATNMPDRIPSGSMPMWQNGSHAYKNQIGFETNLSPVDLLKKLPLSSVYTITTNDTYTLKVCPVIYEMDANGQFFKRIDLPCVSTNVFLSPDK